MNLPEITYTLKEGEFPKLKRRQLRHGVPVDGGKAVEFWAEGRTVRISIANRPELEAAVAAYQAAVERQEAEQAKRRQAIADACPAECVPAELVWVNGDLCAAKYRLVGEGIEVLGPDTLKPAGEGIYYLPRDLVKEEIERAEAERRRLAWLNEPIPEAALEDHIPIPEYALEVYRRYRGSAEAAWEAEDEEAWRVIQEWGPLIARRTKGGRG